MAPQYQVYSLPGTDPAKQVFTVSDGFVPASQTNLSNSNQNFNLTAWMVGLADPGQYGQLNLYEVPQGTAGPANADAEISANKTVSSDITLLDQHGSEVLLGETLMVPIANSMVYLRPLYASPTTNPQPQLQYVVGVLGKTVQIDTSLTAVLSDLLQTTVLPPASGVSSTGTVPAAVAGLLQQAQTDYSSALAALKAQNLSQFQTDINAMQQSIAQAQQVISATTPGATTTTTTTTTVPAVKGSKTSKKDTTTTTSSSHASTTTSVPTSTEPKNATTTTSTTLVSAAPKT
jgi:hypothetical protein